MLTKGLRPTDSQTLDPGVHVLLIFQISCVDHAVCILSIFQTTYGHVRKLLSPKDTFSNPILVGLDCPQGTINAGSTGGKQKIQKNIMDILGLSAVSPRTLRGPDCLQDLRIMIFHVQISILLRKSQHCITRTLIILRVSKTDISI